MPSECSIMSSDKNDKWVDDTSREINNKSTNTER